MNIIRLYLTLVSVSYRSLSMSDLKQYIHCLFSQENDRLATKLMQMFEKVETNLRSLHDTVLYEFFLEITIQFRPLKWRFVRHSLISRSLPNQAFILSWLRLLVSTGGKCTPLFSSNYDHWVILIVQDDQLVQEWWLSRVSFRRTDKYRCQVSCLYNLFHCIYTFQVLCTRWIPIVLSADWWNCS